MVLQLQQNISNQVNGQLQPRGLTGHISSTSLMPHHPTIQGMIPVTTAAPRTRVMEGGLWNYWQRWKRVERLMRGKPTWQSRRKWKSGSSLLVKLPIHLEQPIKKCWELIPTFQHQRLFHQTRPQVTDNIKVRVEVDHLLRARVHSSYL